MRGHHPTLIIVVVLLRCEQRDFVLHFVGLDCAKSGRRKNLEFFWEILDCSPSLCVAVVGAGLVRPVVWAEILFLCRRSIGVLFLAHYCDALIFAECEFVID